MEDLIPLQQRFEEDECNDPKCKGYNKDTYTGAYSSHKWIDRCTIDGYNQAIRGLEVPRFNFSHPDNLEACRMGFEIGKADRRLFYDEG